MGSPPGQYTYGRRPKRRLSIFRIVSIVIASLIGLVIVYWIGGSVLAWVNYGSAQTQTQGRQDTAALDHFMPVYEVDDAQDLAINAPWTNTYRAECLMDLRDSPAISAVLDSRARVLGSTPDPEASKDSPAFIAQAISFGWNVLAEDPGHEIILGAVAQPWQSNVQFQSLLPDQFESFETPDYAKILFTFDAEPATATTSTARTELRVVTTDADARNSFRRYWAMILPGIRLMRSQALDLVRTAAEQSFATNGAAAPMTCDEIEKASAQRM